MSTLKIGEKIRAKRREHDLTQEELANMLGVTKASISKWENDESFPDITMLPHIAQLFHITMDELFNYTLERKPLVIVNEYQFGFSLDDVDRRILDHGTVKSYEICKCSRPVGEDTEDTWKVRVQFVSTEENFPHILQKHIKPGVLTDGISVRLADGKAMMDDKPNKHFVCSEKIWEYNIKDRKYLCQMLKELREMGLSDEDDV